MVVRVIFFFIIFANLGRLMAQEQQIPESFVIQFIDVKGTNSLDPYSIKSLSGLYTGLRINKSDQKINRAIHKLWKNDLVEDVKVHIVSKEGGHGILIEIKESPRLAGFEVVGLKQSEWRNIKPKLGLTKGVRITQKLKTNTIHQIETYLRDKGFEDADVNLSFKPNDILTEQMDLLVEVKRKTRYRVRRIDFHGNQVVTEKKLRRVMKSVDTKYQLDFSNSFYNPEKIKSGRQELQDFYHALGMIDFSVDSMYLDFDRKRDEVIINLAVTEGDVYRVRSLQLEGNKSYDSTFIRNIISLKEGEVYNPILLDQKLHYDPKGLDLSSVYMDNGHLFFEVQPVVLAVDHGEVDLLIRIKEGPEATVNNVSIKGNTITNDHVLYRQITTLPGDVFRRSELIRSQSNLAMLGFLDPEAMNVIPMPNPVDGTVDLEYQVQERPNDQIELAGTWGAVTGLTGSLGFVANNFAISKLFKPKLWNPYPNGNGEKFALRVQSNGSGYTNYSLNYSNPWISQNKPLSLFTSLNHTRFSSTDIEVTEAGEEIEVDEKLNITGGTIGLSRQLSWPDNYWSLSNSISFFKYNYENYDNALGVEDGVTYNATFNTTLSRNTINHPFYPSSGSNFSASLGLTPPYSLFLNPSEENPYKWAEYMKLMVDYKYHKKLAGKLVFKMGAHFGLVNNYSSNNPLGPFERFELGGSGLTGNSILVGNDVISLRGYPDEALKPVDSNGLAGGVIYQKFNVELRHPIVLTSSFSAYLAAFAETGNTWSSISKYNPLRTYSSAGIGVRFNIPMMGQVGLDWGYGFDKLPGQNKRSGGNFQFSIGVPIR